MNQPTEDRIKRIEEEQKRLGEEQEAIKKRLEQQETEPIKIDHLEIDRGGTRELLKETNKKLDKIIQTQTDRSEKFDALEHGQQELKQELHAVSNTWLDTLQEHYTEHKRDIKEVQTIQKGHSKFFEEHGKRLAATATKDDLTAMQGQIKQDTGTIETRLDRMESDITSMKTTQEQILQLLQQKPSE